MPFPLFYAVCTIGGKRKQPLDTHREDEVDEMVEFFESLGGFEPENDVEA